MLQSFKNKRIFLTGHTGFKGSWMLQILNLLGAQVKGYALPPENEHDLYKQIDGDKLCYSSVVGDLLDVNLLKGEMVRFNPHIVIHMAAQSLVRKSYVQTLETFNTNIIGTANVLEAIRQLPDPCVGIMVTTDKVYDNPERGIPFSESDKLGGHDPYSASKAAAEIVISSYRHSFFNNEQIQAHGKSIASVRAGNVIGGGDYNLDRLIPDMVRGLQWGEPVRLRNPNATRPWQHVLEPVVGYLILAEKMLNAPADYNEAYNFGPKTGDEKTVKEVADIFYSAFGSTFEANIETAAEAPYEAKLLHLDSSKAQQKLTWLPKLTPEQAITWTAQWYADKETTALQKCETQIAHYLGWG